MQNKQTFISQIMTSKTLERSHEDIDEKALSYAEIKALATGNDMIIEKTELDTEVAKLKLLKQSHLSQIYALEDAIVKYYPVEIKKANDLIVGIQKDIEVVKEKTKSDSEDSFSTMILKGQQYNEKESAGKTILEICKNKTESEQEEIGEYRGMKMFLEIDTWNKSFKIILKNNASYTVNLGSDIHGNITRIDNVIADMEKRLNQTKGELQNLEKQFENAKIDVEVPFNKEQELQEKLARLDNINRLLNINEKDSELLDDGDEEQKEDKEEQEQDKECQEHDEDYFR